MGGLLGGGSPVTSQPMLAQGIQLQSSQMGVPVPIIFGRNRVSGFLMWYGNFQAIPVTSTASGGGKGGGGGGGSNVTGYKYSAAFMEGIGEGPISGILQTWAGRSISPGALPFTTFVPGNYGQAPWFYLSTYFPSQALGYSGVAYVATPAYDLGSSPSLPNHNFEVEALYPYNPGAGLYDADPKDVLEQLLTNKNFGALFPTSMIGDLTQFSNYCVANGILLSPYYNAQSACNSMITDLMMLTNSEVFLSEGKIKVVPRGDMAATGNGVTFTPNVTPLYDLSDDDFLAAQGAEPVKCMRCNVSDAYNNVKVDYNDRNNYYQTATVEAFDQASIQLYGLRSMSKVSVKGITLAQVAKTIAHLLLQRALYIRSTFSFRLGWRYSLLEPMDIVTITDAALGLNKWPVRITETAEDEWGTILVTAEDFPAGIGHNAVYSSQLASSYAANYNQTPGNVMPPAFYERRVSNQIVLGIAATGNDALWGGCNVWVSQDNATFKQVAVVSGRARYGSLNTATGSTTSDVLDVTLVGLGGKMLSGTAQDANQYVTECYVDGEIVSYETATLTDANRYVLSALRRGGYGTTAAAHAAGSSFIRVDDAIVESAPLDVSMIGQPLWFKFTSFNVFGGGQQQLAEVQAFQYVVKGTPLYAQLANVQNLVDVFRDGRTMLTWDVVVDDRNVDYEIRKGATWWTAQVLGRTLNTEFVPDGDGTYWVAGHADQAYSATPTSITLAGSVLVANIVATFDEEATLWSGSVSGGAMVRGTGIVLAGAGLFSAITLLSGVSSIVYFGGVAPSGTYTVPVGHEVDVGTSQPCNCSVSYRLRADNPYALFSAIPDVAALASMTGNYSGLADARVQIAIAPDSGVYAAWRDFVPGTYVGRKFRLQVLLSSSDPSVTAILDTFAFTVDMPDRVERGTGVNCPVGGMTVTYARPFQVVPNVQITIQGAVQNDAVVLTGQTTTGFTVQILQGGGVARTINWLAQGY